MRRFEPGESVVLREVLDGRVWAARPATVVRDDEPSIFYVPIGARWVGPIEPRPWVRFKARGWTLGEHVRRDAHVLSFAWPGDGHAILHLWERDWTPRSWYVNVQAPLRRFDLGFETLDHELDVVVSADRTSWRWKDEEDLETGLASGLYTKEQAAGFRREGERGLRRLVDREPPLDREWADWRPDPSWPIPTLPVGWDLIGASEG